MFNTIIENFHIEKILSTLKNNIVYMIITGVVIALISSVAGSYFSYTYYRVDVSFYVYSNPDNVTNTGVNLSTSDISQANKLISSYVQVLRSSAFLSQVVDALPLEGYTVKELQENISAKAVSDTAIFIVYVYDENPNNALTIANTITELAPTAVHDIVKAGGFTVLDAAKLPTSPIDSLHVYQIMLVGFVGGFVLAFVFFLLKGMLDTTIKRIYEVEDIFTIPVLGQVPDVSSKKKGEENKITDIILKDDSRFIVKEAYNDIRSNLLFGNEDEGCQIYVVTSADALEGKTVNAYNMARSFAGIGKKVLLIDADMRSSILRTIAPNEHADGLADYLNGQLTAAPVISIDSNMDIVYSSENIKDRAELLSTQKWYDFIAQMQEKYDEIIIDMPCLGVYSDALNMVKTSAKYVIIIREGKTKFVRTKMIVRRIEELKGEIVGIIYNGISIKSKDYVFRNYKEEAKG